MRKPGRFVAWLSAAVLVGWGLSWALPRLPGALAEIEWFRVRAVHVEGIRYLTAADVQHAAAVPPEANLWDDTEPVAARVRAHPLVREARVRRRLPGNLLVQVEERQPVGLIPTPTLEPVDREGRVLPVDPARHRLDLPVIRATPMEKGPPAPAAFAAAAREAERLAELDPAFWADVSVMTADGSGTLVLEWGEPGVLFRFRTPIAPPRLRQAMTVLADAADRSGSFPNTVDLRFADQVVVRWGGPE